MRVLAIDFGTSNSLLASATAAQVFAPIPLDPTAVDPTVLRSVLYFVSTDEVYFGSQGIDEFVAHDLQGRLLRSIKKFLPLRTFSGTQIDGKNHSIEDLIAIFLREMRVRAEAHFGAATDAVVLGRPARFSEDEEADQLAQKRLEKAARLAGFSSIEFLPEPVAAAREFQKHIDREQLVLVADYGGGTSDYTVIKLGPRPFKESDVLAIGGVSQAGDALDGSIMRNRIAQHFGSDVKYVAPFGSNILTMPKILMEKICAPADISFLTKRDTLSFFEDVRKWSLGHEEREKIDALLSLIHNQLGFSVFEAIERLKRNLSDSEKAKFEFSYPDLEIKETIKRSQFEAYAEEPLSRIVASLDDTLKRAQVAPSQIDQVCCTGGTAKVPAIRRELEARFGAEKVRAHRHFHSIVEGLSERARELAQS